LFVAVASTALVGVSIYVVVAPRLKNPADRDASVHVMSCN